jgi:hypothetical protein
VEASTSTPLLCMKKPALLDQHDMTTEMEIPNAGTTYTL